MFGVHWYWIALAAAAYFGVGALWYSPVMFLKQWQALVKRQPTSTNMATASMISAFITILILVMVEAYFVAQTGTHGIWRGVLLGAKLWLGFVATTAMVNYIFQGSSRTLLLIDQGYHFVGIVLAGAILAL